MKGREFITHLSATAAWQLAAEAQIAAFQHILETLNQLTIDVQLPLNLDEIGPLTDFAVAHQLTAYDAAYVQLAMRNNARLATLDRAMRAAAAKLNIPLLPA